MVSLATVIAATGQRSASPGFGKRVLIRDRHGSDVLHGFDIDRDLLAFDMAEIRPRSDVAERSRDVKGNAVPTFDNGDQLTVKGIETAKLITLEKVNYRDRDDPSKPILIPEGVLGIARPHSDLIVYPQQRIVHVD